MMFTSKHSAPASQPDDGTRPTPRRGVFRVRCLGARLMPGVGRHVQPAIKLLVCLCMLSTLAGCLPERQWKVPVISGTVTANGQPAGGVKVLITRTESSCNEPLSVETTDAQGRFSYQGAREWGIGRIFVTPTQTFSICLQSGSNPIVGYSRRYGGYSHIAVNCELEQKAARTQESLCKIDDRNY